jgi:uncharacterized protein
MKQIIDEIGKIVEAACARDSNIFGYSIWTHHITQVARIAREIAPEFQADPEVVEIAALLHDYASVKDQALFADHHIHGPVEAEKILRELGCPDDKTEAVKHCIAAHRASVPTERNSPEAECLANADAMTHIEQVPSLLHLAFVQNGLGTDEGAIWVRDKLQRTWKKLSPHIQERMRGKYEAALKTLTDLEPDSDPNHSKY